MREEDVASDGKLPQRIELVYQDALENIAFTKKQEWIVVGYGFALNAGIVTVAKQLVVSNGIKVTLTLIALGIPLYGAAVLRGYFTGLKKWRARLTWIYETYFPAEERSAMMLGRRSPGTEIVFFGGLGASLFVAAIVAILAIWCSVPS
jgi:hypothetical protein